MRETGELLKEMYLLADAQVVMGKDDLELAVDWAALRMRFAAALIREGFPLPELPEAPPVIHGRRTR